MLHAYAIEPDVLVTWDKCRNTLNLMGFQHGRAIAAYPSRKRWKAFVRAACRRNIDLGDHDRKRILRKLEQSNAKLVRSEAAYDDGLSPSEECWIRNAVARQGASPVFHAILSTRNPDGHPDVVLEEDVDESHSKFHVSRDVQVLREPGAIVAHIGTLVRNSRELLLIDPHFDPSEYRWRPVVKACIGLASHEVRDGANVTIHTLDADRKPSLEEFRQRCLRHVAGMLAGKVAAIRVCRWRIRPDSSRDFHARYVLTDRGGYKLDKGLDEERGVEQLVSLLDHGAWQDLYDMYRDPGRFFEKDGEFTVG